MQGEIENSGPRCALFAPDEDFAIVTSRCEDIAIFWVCPRDRPDGAFVTGGLLVTCWESKGTEDSPLQCLGQTVRLSLYLENLYCLIG